MTIRKTSSPQVTDRAFDARFGERGAALAAALLMLGLLSAVALTVLAVVTSESRVAGSDLKRTQTFYAAAAGIEKMTSDYSALFQQSARPTDAEIAAVADDPPEELKTVENYDFKQSIILDDATLSEMRKTQGLTAPQLPTATLPADSAFVGLIATVKPYIMNSRATSHDGTSVTLTRTMNNYLIPLFQFGMFSDNDIELHPGADFVFNGRVHANGNIYFAGKVGLLDKVTSAHEVIYDYQRNGKKFTAVTTDVWMGVGAAETHATLNKGSIQFGPHIECVDPDGADPLPLGGPNCFPTSPTGTLWPSSFNWKTTSVKPANASIANQFGGQLLTRVTGASELRLPMELDGNPTREIIKRRLPTDNAPLPAETSPLSDSRFHSKAGIRILIDDEAVTTDAAGLYAPQNGDEFGNPHDGVFLSSFNPIPLPNATGGGRALWRVRDDGTYRETTANCPFQQNGSTPAQAVTVRSASVTTPLTAFTPTGSNIANIRVPRGAGLSGRILIQIVDADGKWRDVTKEILSMGMTVGEPNAIVHLQRPLWAAFTQGSRDSSGGSNNLADIINSIGSTYIPADGEIKHTSATVPAQNATYGFLTSIQEDDGDVSGAHPKRADVPPVCGPSDWGGSSTPLAAWYTNNCWNTIVPINVYNVREGRLSTTSGTPTDEPNEVYERGITSVVEINMENLSRWLDGVYDKNLLEGTLAESKNIKSPDGFIVYVSDRRGDNVKSMTLPKFGTKPVAFSTFTATNGMADNIDIYYNGATAKMDAGEDVQETGVTEGTALPASLRDTAELPVPAALSGTGGNNLTARIKRALTVAAWTNPNNYFRGSVRLFNGADLQAAGTRLSTTLGITVSSENLMYTWGNYNTAGINEAPASGKSSLNDTAEDSHYLSTSGDRQVPASIVADAWFPLSKTWFDSTSAMYPDDTDPGTVPNVDKRIADLLLTGTLPDTAETSVRAGVIVGNNLSALSTTCSVPDAGNCANNESRLNGGIHNLPRLLENWDASRLNFVGALIPLYRSTQALGPYNANSTIYTAPIRNWAFDITFTNPLRLPPGTPMFQHVEPTGFKQVL